MTASTPIQGYSLETQLALFREHFDTFAAEQKAEIRRLAEQVAKQNGNVSKLQEWTRSHDIEAARTAGRTEALAAAQAEASQSRGAVVAVPKQYLGWAVAGVATVIAGLGGALLKILFG